MCEALKLAVLLGAALLLTGFRSPAQGESVALAWDASTDTSIVGYRIYEGCASRTYTNSIDAGDVTSYTVTGLVGGATYYFAVTAYDAEGLESDFSDEVVYTVPFPTPPLAVTSCGKLPSCGFSITANATSGETCVVFAAMNLVPPIAWSPIATNTADAQGVFTYEDLNATNYPRRFYRVVGQ